MLGLNPHLDEAQKDSKAWARQMGMLDFVWSDRKFDACDSRIQFRRTVEKMTGSWLWDLANHMENLDILPGLKV